MREVPDRRVRPPAGWGHFEHLRAFHYRGFDIQILKLHFEVDSLLKTLQKRCTLFHCLLLEIPSIQIRVRSWRISDHKADLHLLRVGHLLPSPHDLMQLFEWRPLPRSNVLQGFHPDPVPASHPTFRRQKVIPTPAGHSLPMLSLIRLHCRTAGSPRCYCTPLRTTREGLYCSQI